MNRYLVLAAALLTCGAAHAQYPTKPVRLVVLNPPGGSADLVARVIGQKLAESWGQQVVIDNRPGGGGIIGSEAVARAAPDGYSLVVGTIGPFAINVSLYKLPYDILRDFAPVSYTGNVGNILVVSPAFPAKNVTELIALAKAKPGALTFASGGTGGAPHMAGELFKILAGVSLVHVPYKGGAASMTALIGGEVHMSFTSTTAAMPFVKSGKLRALGLSAAKRSPTLPEVPTVTEAGLPGFVVRDWQAIFTTAKTPPAIIRRLNGDIARVLALPDVREKLANTGFEAQSSTPEELGTFVASEIALWAKVVKDGNIRAE